MRRPPVVCYACLETLGDVHVCVVPVAVKRTPPGGSRPQRNEVMILPEAARRLEVGREGVRCHPGCVEVYRAEGVFNISPEWGPEKFVTWARHLAECVQMQTHEEREE